MKAKWAIALGNLLEHYCTALYALLAPFLAPIFFPFVAPTTALLFTYALIPLSFLARPLGALFFGWVGDTVGRKESLVLSLSGTSIVTCLIAFLPTYETMGMVAPILLALAKSGQKFFSAGESVGGAILFLENSPKEKRSFFSSLYDATTILGILVASFLSSLLAAYSDIEISWRILYLLGSFVGIIAFLLRKKFFSQMVQPISNPSKISFSSLLTKRSFFAIAFAAGFSHLTFTFSFTFLNGYLPCITSFSKSLLLQINSYLLLADLCLLPFFGYLSMVYGKEKILRFGLFGTLLCSIPLFSLLSFSSIWLVVVVRFLLLFFGTAFAAPFYAWALEKADPDTRSTTISLASSLGAQWIGAPASAISIWLFQKTHLIFAPAFYTIAIGGLVWYFLQASREVHSMEKEKI